MLRQPTEGHHVFEVSIYNQEVRRLVKQNESHQFFDDHWADLQLHDVLARDEHEARALIARRFPPDDGFVVECVTETHI
ncbi:MAG: hypothetical protein RIC16_00905 [Rhodospirillales bacterium]